MAYKTNVDINSKCAKVKNKDPNRNTIQIFIEQCLNDVIQRITEMNLNGVAVK